jgi:hypothetical protein
VEVGGMSRYIDQATFERMKGLQNTLEEHYVAISQDTISSVARPFINAHCRNTLKALRALHLQAYQVLDEFQDRDWFKDISESLKDFLETFPTASGISSLGNASSSLKSVVTYPGFGVLFAATGIGAVWSQIEDFCICFVVLGLAVYGVPWIIYSVVFGFRKKRSIFLDRRIYELEGDLLTLLRIMNPVPAKRRVIQYDVLGWSLCAVIAAIATVTTRDHRDPDEYAYPLFARGFWYFLAAVSIALIVVAISMLFSSRRRPWAWSVSTKDRSAE